MTAVVRPVKRSPIPVIPPGRKTLPTPAPAILLPTKQLNLEDQIAVDIKIALPLAADSVAGSAQNFVNAARTIARLIEEGAATLPLADNDMDLCRFLIMAAKAGARPKINEFRFDGENIGLAHVMWYSLKKAGYVVSRHSPDTSTRSADQHS